MYFDESIPASERAALRVAGFYIIDEIVDYLIFDEVAAPTEPSGVLSATEGRDTFTIAGKVIITSSFNKTEGVDTVAISGSVTNKINASFAASEARDVIASTAKVIVQCIASCTEAKDSFAGSADVVVHLNALATEAKDSFFGTGNVAAAGKTASMAALENADTFSAELSKALSGHVEIIESVDGFYARLEFSIGDSEIERTVSVTKRTDVVKHVCSYVLTVGPTNRVVKVTAVTRIA